MLAYKLLAMLILCLLLVCGCSDTSASYKIMTERVSFAQPLGVAARGMPLGDSLAIPSPDETFTGLLIVYRKESGTKYMESWYKNGMRDGLTTWYWGSGKIYTECVYRNGLPWMGTPGDQVEISESDPIYIWGREVASFSYKIEEKE